MDSEDEIDEQQDWLLLSEDAKKNPLKRGEKDFEPDGTGTQESLLAGSRAAMYDALQGERKHNE